MKKSLDVQKFGGVDHLGETQMDGYSHDIESVETQSTTNLEMDTGYGNAAVIRMFEFAANPQTFKEHPPTKQDLFNAHYKGIEVALWKDGLKVVPEVNPRVTTEGSKYRIWVTATPMKGHILTERPKTLTEIAHG